jgi:hypothetical protein
MLNFNLSRIFDYLVLSFLAAAVFCLGHTFTAASMLMLYGTVYAFIIDGDGMF